MTEPGITEQGNTPQSIPGAADEPTVPPEAAVLAAAGLQVLATKLANRWTLAAAAAVVAFGVAAVLLRRWHAPLTAED